MYNNVMQAIWGTVPAPRLINGLVAFNKNERRETVRFIGKPPSILEKIDGNNIIDGVVLIDNVEYIVGRDYSNVIYSTAIKITRIG